DASRIDLVAVLVPAQEHELPPAKQAAPVNGQRGEQEVPVVLSAIDDAGPGRQVSLAQLAEAVGMMAVPQPYVVKLRKIPQQGLEQGVLIVRIGQVVHRRSRCPWPGI